MSKTKKGFVIWTLNSRVVETVFILQFLLQPTIQQYKKALQLKI